MTHQCPPFQPRLHFGSSSAFGGDLAPRLSPDAGSPYNGDLRPSRPGCPGASSDVVWHGTVPLALDPADAARPPPGGVGPGARDPGAGGRLARPPPVLP